MYRVHETLSWKYPAQNRAGRVAEVVEYLPSNHEPLCSNPVPQNRRDNQESVWHILESSLPLCLIYPLQLVLSTT
jgi:hypothetical protein